MAPPTLRESQDRPGLGRGPTRSQQLGLLIVVFLLALFVWWRLS